jgi:hypothetical protein
MKILFLVVLYIFRSFWDVELMIKIKENRTKYVSEGPVGGYRGFDGALYQDLC